MIAGAERLIELLDTFRRKTIAGIEAINAKSQNKQEADRQYKSWRTIVEAIVKRVNIREDKSIKVELEIQLPVGEETKSSPDWWR
jgi:hypothetical protein